MRLSLIRYHMHVYTSCLQNKWICYYGCVFIKGGPIVLREVTAHWMDSLIASPSKKDAVFMHMSKGQDCIFMLQQVMVGKSICAHQELSANLTNVTSKRILLVRSINIFFINTHFVEVCIVVLGT